MVWNKCLSTNQRLLRMQAAQSTIQLLSIWISTLGELNNPIGTWLIAAFLLKVFPISRTLKCMRGVSFGGFPWLVSLVGLLFCGCLFVSACLFVLVHALKIVIFFLFWQILRLTCKCHYYLNLNQTLLLQEIFLKFSNFQSCVLFSQLEHFMYCTIF